MVLGKIKNARKEFVKGPNGMLNCHSGWGVVRSVVVIREVTCVEINTHPSVAFPVHEEPIFVDFEEAVGLRVAGVLFLVPSVENTALQQGFGHWDAPIEFELFCHYSQPRSENNE
jgi:hypothetical protein